MAERLLLYANIFQRFLKDNFRRSIISPLIVFPGSYYSEEGHDDLFGLLLGVGGWVALPDVRDKSVVNEHGQLHRVGRLPRRPGRDVVFPDLLCLLAA